MPAEDQDRILREMAQHRGFRLVKSRRRKPGVGDYGKFGLADAKTGKKYFGFGGKGLTATAEQIENYLRDDAVSTWKESAGSIKARPAQARARREQAEPEDVPSRKAEIRPRRAAAEKKAPPKPVRLKPAPVAEPEPEPKPVPEPELRIRKAAQNDAEALLRLMIELGADMDAKSAADRIAAFARLKEPVLVADRGGIVGCAAWHVLKPFHRPPIGRLTMIVVAREMRRKGIGRALLEASEAEMKARGCALFEAIGEIDFSGSQSFFRRLGYDRKSYRYAKPAEPGQAGG